MSSYGGQTCVMCGVALTSEIEGDAPRSQNHIQRMTLLNDFDILNWFTCISTSTQNMFHVRSCYH